MSLLTRIAFAAVSLPFAASAFAAATPLRDHWELQSACKLQAAPGNAPPDGSLISTPEYHPQGWYPTAVPATVLAAQVAAGAIDKPYYGMNLRQIPGTDYPIGKNFSNLPMPAGSPYACGWWYRRQFSGTRAEKGGAIYLHFGGINYRADIWLNGNKVADKSQVAGAYRTYDIDVTAAIATDRPNVLAVETFAPTEKDLGINWVDWNPCPPDKDMGLWGAVDLVTTGPVSLKSPLAVTHFPDSSLKEADLTVYAEVHNASEKPIHGILSGTAAGVALAQPVDLAPHQDTTIVFSPAKFPQLKLKNPQVWWPYQMGTPTLQKLALKFTAAGELSDQAAVDFGIREVTSELTANNSRLFRINGKPILIRGAGWSQDMLLRQEPAHLRDEFRLVKDMHLNTIRLEGKLETQDFFELADQQGILVLLGWCCCDQWEHWKDWTPENYSVAAESLRSQMLRIRHHASLLVWLNGSDNPPPAFVESAYLRIEAETHWPNPTLSSASADPTTVSGTTGVKMTGPYDYVAPSYWYVDTKYGGAHGFNTETSPGPAIPNEASLKQFIPAGQLWPPEATWSFHYGGGGFKDLSVFNDAMSKTYAVPQSSADYIRLSQTMTYDGERAMFEAYGRNKYTSTGVIQWMLNNAWPSMIWHLFDYYLDADGGYFGTKKACEVLHVQYSYDDHSIVVVNSTYEPAPGLTASVHVYDLNLKPLFSAEKQLDAGPDSATRVIPIANSVFQGGPKLYFVDLALKNAKGETISKNFYWVPATLTTFDWAKTNYTHTPAIQPEDLTALAALPKAEIQAKMRFAQSSQGREIQLELHNPSKALAFQIAAAARTAGGDLIAPVLWSDNYIELMPGESRTLTAILPAGSAKVDPGIQLSGWNIAPQTLSAAKPQTAALSSAALARARMAADAGLAVGPVTLRRTLRFSDLVLYGIILIQPTAPMPSFGVIYHDANGHVVTAILFALVAMLFTSVSYGRMARVYPQGGSAFMYVGKELHASLGYLTGWCMAMDYILNPLICTIWCSKAAQNFVPEVPYFAWAVFFAVLFTWLNLNGVETSARINTMMAAALGVVIVLVVVSMTRYLWHLPHQPASFYTVPFYDPARFSSKALFRGTSIAVLTYIGFDGISTLSDEAKSPERNIPRAIIFTCFVTGVLASIEVYLGQLVWPRGLAFPDIDTAYVHIAGRAGGPIMFAIVNGALLLATIGSGMASQLGAARLLLAMGQDGAIPRKFFGAVHAKNRIPRNNVLMIGAICLVGALIFSYELGTELLNYGALLAFMGVNVASAVLGWRQGRGKQWLPITLSLAGFVVCLFIWLNLGTLAKIAGTGWAIVGVLVWLLHGRKAV